MAALRLQPDLHEARVRLASILNHVGLLDDASALLERVIREKPDHPTARYQQGMCLYHAGRLEAANETLAEVARVSPDLGADSQLAFCEVRLGRLEAAARSAELGARLDADPALTHAILALIAALRGEADTARDLIRRIRDGASFGHYHHAQYEAACALAQLGDTEPGLDWLEATAANGYPSLSLFETDPLLGPLRDHDRYRSLVARLQGAQAALADLLRSPRHEGTT